MSAPHGRLCTRRPGMRGVARQAGSRSRTSNRVTTGPEPVLMPHRWRLPGVASVAAGSWRRTRAGWRRSGAVPRASRAAGRTARRVSRPYRAGADLPAEAGAGAGSAVWRAVVDGRAPVTGRRSPGGWSAAARTRARRPAAAAGERCLKAASEQRRGADWRRGKKVRRGGLDGRD